MAAPMDPNFGQFVAGEGLPDGPVSPQLAADPATPSESEVLRTQLAERDATIRDLASRPAQAPSQAAPVAAELPLGAMPDPTAEPAQFQAWQLETQRRSEARTMGAIAQTRDAAMQEVRARDITSEFVQKHPEYVSLLGDVRQELANAVGELGYAALPDDATELHRRAEVRMRARAQQYGETATIRDGVATTADPNRVAGLAAGTKSAAPTKQADDSESKPVSMIEALRKQHRANGFH